MEAMQCYRLRTILCDSADMTCNTISTLFLIRQTSHFVPLHSPDSADSLIFSHPKAEPARRKRQGIYPKRFKLRHYPIPFALGPVNTKRWVALPGIWLPGEATKPGYTLCGLDRLR